MQQLQTVDVIAFYQDERGVTVAHAVLPVRSIREFRELCEMSEKHEVDAKTGRTTFTIRD